MKIADIMVTDVKTVTNDTTVTKALALMEREHVKELPVLSGGKVKGLISLHSIVTFPNYTKDLKVTKLMFKPPVLSEGDDLYTALRLMKEAGVQGLPVTRGESIVGFVSDYDLLKVLKKELKGLTVNDFMRETPPLLQETDNIAKAKRLLFYEKARSLPVVNSKNKLVGVLNEQDLLDFYKPHESMGRGGGGGESDKLLKASIKEAPYKDYHYARIGESITKVIDLMLSNHLTSIVIVDDEHEPIGYLERFEFIKYLYNERKPRGVFLTLSGLKLDYPTNALLTKVVSDHLNRVNYLAKSIAGIDVRVKGLHAGSGVRKFELDLKVKLSTGVTQRVKKVGYALRECLDEALTDVEKLMKKNYKRSNP